MSEVGIRALKQNASKVVAQVVAGEVVTVTDRGRPVAQMAPPPTSRLEALISSGRARPPRRMLADLPVPTRMGRGGAALSEELERMRQTERP